MPGRPRLRAAGIPFHIIQRGNNRSACFYADEDYQYYQYYLEELSKKEAIAVHAYVLMTNHVHLLLTPETGDGVSRLMKQLGQRHVQYINREYRRSGTLWEGRFRSCLVDAENYLLICQRHIELNPVRAGMVEHPADYQWSSYGHNAQGLNDSVIKRHDVYLALGSHEKTRQAAYRELFRYELDPGMIDELRENTNGGYSMGSDRFKREIAAALDRRVEPGKPVTVDLD